MSEVLENYNEADAAAFVHEKLSKSMQEKYNADDIGYILDLVYEYYETIEQEVPDGINDAKGVNDLIDGQRMVEFVNKGLESANKPELTQFALKEILMLDNNYMDSIDNDADDADFNEFVDTIYERLPDDVKQKYGVEDLYLILGFEASYYDETEGEEEVDEEALCSYIINSAAEEDLDIDRKTLDIILEIEDQLFEEEEEEEEK